jgi:hypothetical protein
LRLKLFSAKRSGDLRWWVNKHGILCRVDLLAKAHEDVAEFLVAEVQQWVAAALTAGGLEGSIEDVSSDVGEVVAVLKKQKAQDFAGQRIDRRRPREPDAGGTLGGPVQPRRRPCRGAGDAHRGRSAATVTYKRW